MESTELVIKNINDCFSLQMHRDISIEEVRSLLTVIINDLIQTDFQKLVAILYRVDVSEIKLKILLKETPGKDAGLIIADLIIERQIQKLKSRNQSRQTPPQQDEESW